MERKKYVFKINEKKALYDKEKGYGIWHPEMTEDEGENGDRRHQNIKGTDGYVALKSGGWTNRRLGEGSDQRNVRIFKFDVPEFGTYSVELVVKKGDSDIRNMAVFAGRRNMVGHKINLLEEKTYNRNFYVAVTPYIPALSSERCDDKNIFISLTGVSPEDEKAEISVEITREDVPVIWIAGDSTVTDQNAGIPYYPYGSCAGWAQILQMFIKDAAVCNLSHSGMTTNCFRDDGHYAIALEFMKKGDFFVIQFGHNDQKRRNLNAYGGYADNLRKYVDEVRKKGVTPVICSPISRIPLKKSGNNEYYSLLISYAKACKKVSEEMNVAFADLHDKTFHKWIEYGEKARDFFMPGDITHTNEYGAVLIADIFMKELRKKQAESTFSRYDNGRTEEEVNPEDDTKVLPKELPGADIFGIEPPYLDIKGIREYEQIKKAFRYGLLDPCVMYLHPDDVMPRAQLLMVMFKAFRIPGKRPYEGKFADIEVDEWDSGYVQTLIEENLIDEATLRRDEEGNYFFRPDAPLTYEEFASFLFRFMEKDKEKRTISLDVCVKSLVKLGLINTCNDGSVENKCVNIYEGDDYYNKDYLLGYQKAYGNYIPRAEVYAGLSAFMDIAGKGNSELPEDAEVHPVH